MANQEQEIVKNIQWARNAREGARIRVNAARIKLNDPRCRNQNLVAASGDLTDALEGARIATQYLAKALLLLAE